MTDNASRCRTMLGRGSQLNQISTHLVFKHFLQSWFNNFIRWEIDAERIYVLLVIVELKVKMVTRCAASGPHIANNLAFSNRHTGVNSVGEAIHVSVAARVRRVML